MAFATRITATRGVLLRLREQFEFIKKGLEILKMKRDNLAGELNKYLREVRIREEIEKRFAEAYEKLISLYSLRGYSSVHSESLSVEEINITLLPITVMGVEIPRIKIEKKPSTEFIGSSLEYEVAKKLSSCVEDLLKLTIIEVSIERLAQELMMTNRKVNALEKIIVPSYSQLISYIEGRLEEESLEEFIRTRHIRDVLRRRRE